jgi:hypothetical protein
VYDFVDLNLGTSSIILSSATPFSITSVIFHSNPTRH